MSGFMPEAARSPSPEALADLKALARDHGVNAELIKSLTAGKEEARAHLGFFKRMMFMSNGILMITGLAFVGFGLRGINGGYSFLAIISVIIGCLLFLKFLRVFSSMRKAIKVTEVVAHRHKLI